MLRFGACLSCVLLVMTLTGCGKPLDPRPVDLTKGKTDLFPECEVHHVPMQAEFIPVYGEAVYETHYLGIYLEQFPHHGYHRFPFEIAFEHYRDNLTCPDVIDYVCYKCNIAYLAYWKDLEEENAFDNQFQMQREIPDKTLENWKENILKQTEK